MTNNSVGDNPSQNGIHTSNGQFAAGNPHGGQVAKMRSVMLSAVSGTDMKEVVSKKVEIAKAGDLKAIELLLTRTLGKADSRPSNTPCPTHSN